MFLDVIIRKAEETDSLVIITAEILNEKVSS